MIGAKDTRPVVVCYYHPRLRSPSFTDLVKHMKMRSLEGISPIHFELVTDTPSGIDLERVVQHRKCEIPAMVWDGFGSFRGSYVSRTYMATNSIKYMVTIGDVEVHTMEMGNYGDIVNTELFADVIHWPGVEDTPAVDRMQECFEDLITREDALLMCVPFGVDTQKYAPFPNKPIDVSAVYTMSDQNPFQSARTHMARKVLAMYNAGKIDARVGARFHQHYVEVANASKMAVVDTSQRDYMTAKYLEFGSAGALLLGEMPLGSYGIFNSETCALTHLDTATKELESNILFYKENTELREKRALKLRELIIQQYSLEVISDTMEKQIMGVLDG